MKIFKRWGFCMPVAAEAFVFWSKTAFFNHGSCSAGKNVCAKNIARVLCSNISRDRYLPGRFAYQFHL